jgi:hypothetical protein
MSDRERKRQLKASFKGQERAILEVSMPMPKVALRELFEYLDREDAAPCDHTLRDTSRFLERQGIDAKAVVPWLYSHGGYCDCEVMYNVADKYAAIVGYDAGV